MYHNNPRNILAAAALLVTLSATANNHENFNSSRNIPLKYVKSRLQNACWTFHQFDINHNGWNPGIEGDGAMVSSPDALEAGNAGIYTPVLNVTADMDVSFQYRFNDDFGVSSRRWIKLCLADANNNIVQVLDELQLNGSHAKLTNRFATSFKNLDAGNYRFVLLYGGSGGKAKIAIDELAISAPLKYTQGCDISPVAEDVLVDGNPDHTAKGSLVLNTAGQQKAFLVRNSDDGKVDLFPDGTFVFIPDTGFKGTSTNFIYRLCDDGSKLCSEPVNVVINFPGTTLTKFNGSYKFNGNVELAWNTGEGSNAEHFVVERSIDGRSWIKAGEINASKTSSNANEYTYTDNVGKNKALKNDLYYRLKEVTGKGVTNTSKPMIVRVYNTRSLTMICVAPNPGKRELSVNVQLMEPSMVTMRVFDHTNATLIHNSVEAAAGINDIKVEGSRDLAAGNYMLEVIVNSKERMIVKLLKE